MKLKSLYNFSFIAIASTVMLSYSCNTNNSNKAIAVSTPQNPLVSGIKKSASTYQDTLTIQTPTAIFYHPDSVQLLKIKAQTDSTFYEGSMHEYFYQMRNARIVIHKTWPLLSIIESKNYRYLLFVKKDGSKDLIDLDKKNDAFGLFVFNTKKPALKVDMTNIETGISFYLNE
ncbi:hypothetical protein [Ferruginibacter sp.]